MYSYFRPFQHFSFFAANIWSQECVYASSARRMRPIIAQLLSHCNSSKKMLRSTPYRSFKQIRSFNLLRKIDERHVYTEGSSTETVVKGEWNLLYSFAIIPKLFCIHSRRNIQPTSWLLVSWLVDHHTRQRSWEAVKRKYLVYVPVSAISYWNVQLIVKSLLAINVSKWKKMKGESFCI